MKPITVDFFQFSRSLNEWLAQGVIDERQSEAFSLYCLGHSVQFVAAELARMAHQTAGGEPE